ncbi:MAG: O-antigen ligase family protein [Microbacteriaceae bacterium]
MRKILASETLTVAVLVVLFSGDFFRNAITVPGWVALALTCSAWALTTLVINRVSWRALPLTLLIAFAWIVVSPAWSPYAVSSAGLTLGFVFTVCIGLALGTTVRLAALYTRTATALRLILASSLVFELVVALSGSPLYPVGMDAPPGTSIELAWSRGILFESGGRIQGIVGNANLLGMLALVALIIAVVRFAGKDHRTQSGIDFALALLVLFKTASTTVFLAGIAVVAVWALVWLSRRPPLVARVAGGSLIAVGVGVVVYALTHWATFAAALGKSPDMTNRFGIWEAVIDRISVRPITGFGFVGWWPTWEGWFGIHAIRNIRVQQAHNVWLDLAMQVGIVGAVLFAVALGVVGWRLWKQASATMAPTALISVGIVAAMTVQSLTESRILTEWGIALFVVLAVAGTKPAETRTPMS